MEPPLKLKTLVSDETTKTTVKDTDALEVIAENYGICTVNAAKLESLQDWVRQAQIEVNKINAENNK